MMGEGDAWNVQHNTYHTAQVPNHNENACEHSALLSFHDFPCSVLLVQHALTQCTIIFFEVGLLELSGRAGR